MGSWPIIKVSLLLFSGPHLNCRRTLNLVLMVRLAQSLPTSSKQIGSGLIPAAWVIQLRFCFIDDFHIECTSLPVGVRQPPCGAQKLDTIHDYSLTYDPPPIPPGIPVEPISDVFEVRVPCCECEIPYVPEASSLLLLGSAATGLVGYATLQIRARRRNRS